MRALAALTIVAALTVTGVATPAVAQSAEDRVIPLTEISSTEGIAKGGGNTFYVGDRLLGDVYRGDIRTGDVEIFRDAPAGRMATGMKVDPWGRLLFVSGAATGQAYVYDARTGNDVAVFQLGDRDDGTFINDVAVTHNAAWFTDSMQPVLYKVPFDRRGKVGPVETLELKGDAADTSSNFNLNGIAAAHFGHSLLVAHSGNGTIIKVNPRTGDSQTVAGVSVPNADGILFELGQLWVVQNQLNKIARVDLTFDLSRGEVEDEITSRFFQVPTTVARFGAKLAAVNAKFGIPDVTQYEVVVVGAF
jgi:sugar lactone lactonase YvrE